MLNKMSLLLAAAIVALSAGAASADNRDYSNDNYRHDHGYAGNHYSNDRYRYRHHRGQSALMFDFGTVAFGYNDGYWDTGHRWHNWRNRADYDGYRSRGQNFHRWNHDRDHDNGWRNR